jgi:NAD(P)-dependent dehydrogenase (short-subunit alcohol dehydrogenase family)
VVVDVADEAMVAAALARCDTGAHPVDVLVNSAGILQSTRAPSEVSMREWDLTLRVNLRGTYLCAAAFGTRMAARGRGAIVNVASVAGMHAGPLHAYGPGKAAVIHMTQCMAAEWGPRGVRVNAVSPGFTRTPALDRGIDMGAIAETQMKSAAALGRLIDAEEIAHAIGFLASDLASAITGINLPVDAGYLVATPWTAYGGLRRPEPTAAAPSATPPTPRARPV